MPLRSRRIRLEQSRRHVDVDRGPSGDGVCPGSESSVIERVHMFGSHRGLIGVLTEPLSTNKRPDAPAVVFSNVGLNHRVGPGRVYVELARKLAGAGFVALRFDLSGFGDSERRRTDGGDLDRAALDTREALDFLE